MEVYLITGGAGFIGSNFIRYLSERNDIRIINVDKLTYAGNANNLQFITCNCEYIFIQEDICNRTEINQIFSSYHPDYVINFAAESHVDRSIKDCQPFIRTNVLGTQVLLQASLYYGVKKYIQISTDEVYGSLDKDGRFVEDSPLLPRNPYAASKASADMLTQAFYHTYGLPMNITRCTNNYGPYQHPEKFIPLIIKKCLEGKNIPIYGNGENIRDWIHVQDHCHAIYTILKKGSVGEIYNIGANNERQNIEIARTIIQYLQDIVKDHPMGKQHITEDLIQFVEDRKGHDKRYGINAEKLKKELGWLPKYHFSEGLKQTVQWYVDYGGDIF